MGLVEKPFSEASVGNSLRKAKCLWTEQRTENVKAEWLWRLGGVGTEAPGGGSVGGCLLPALVPSWWTGGLCSCTTVPFLSRLCVCLKLSLPEECQLPSTRDAWLGPSPGARPTSSLWSGATPGPFRRSLQALSSRENCLGVTWCPEMLATQAMPLTRGLVLLSWLNVGGAE